MNKRPASRMVWFLGLYLSFPASLAGADEVGRWDLDLGSGVVAADTSGFGNDGTLQGAPTWVVGQSGSALLLDGSGDRVLVDDDPSLDLTTALTVLVWVKPNDVGTQYVVKKAGSGADGYEISLSGTGVPFVRFNKASAGNAYKLLATTPYPSDGNTWMHLAATFDGQTIRLYVDGTLESTMSAPGLAIGSNDEPLSIGGESNGSRSLAGTIDQIHVYDTALSALEIQQVISAESSGGGGPPDTDEDGMPNDWENSYGLDPLDPSDATEDADGDGVTNLDEYLQGTNPRDDLMFLEVGNWALDEGSGTEVGDSSAFANDGSFVGSPAWTAGVRGSALSFDGQGSRVVVPDSATLDLQDSLTIAAWIRPTRRGSQYVIKKARHGSVDGYELSLSSSGRVFVRLNQASEGNNYKMKSDGNYPTDGATWLHVAATFDGQQIKLYLDGVLDTAMAAPGLQIGSNNAGLGIGAQDDGDKPYSGAVDQVHLYDFALTEAEIADLILAETSPDSDGDGMPDDWETSFGLDPLDPSDASQDPDADGVSNVDEFAQGTDPTNGPPPPDTDADGMPDDWEAFYGLNASDPSDATQDPDADGVSSFDEFTQWTDPTNGPPPPDTDADGMPDDWEVLHNFDPLDPSDAAADADNDGTSNVDEFLQGTNPRDPPPPPMDTDGDGMLDDWETFYGLDPLDPSDATQDPDADGVSNVDEFTQGTDPTDGPPPTDTDGDGMPDDWETFYGLNASDPSDAMQDPDADAVSNTDEFTQGTDPTNGPPPPDTDADGMPDDWEAFHGLNASDPSDATQDPDGDGVSNADEFTQGTDPTDGPPPPDTDADGMPDDWEAFYGLNASDPSDAPQDPDDDGVSNTDEFTQGTDPTNGPPPPDTDADGMPDDWEAFYGLNPSDPSDATQDPDDDGVTNADEFSQWTDPTGGPPPPDTDADGMPDDWEVLYGFNLFDPSDAAEDADGDGLTNLEEFLRASDPVSPPEVGAWSFNVGIGTVVADASSFANHGAFVGSPTWISGVSGSALLFNGSGARVVAPDAPSLDITGPITIAAWIRPNVAGSQYVIKKAGSSDGYELSLSSGGEVFVRFNQDTLGNTYKLYSVSSYPTDGTTWMHVAATYDGQDIRLYVDGILESSQAAPGLVIGSNDHGLGFGAEDDGTNPFDGALDQVHLFDFALTESAIQELIAFELSPDSADRPDTDGDGMPDDWETQFELDPFDPSDAALDSDGDGITNLDEFLQGTTPRDPPPPPADTDGDGMPDDWETQFGFDPLDPSDGAEDADGDGTSNLDEFLQGTDPLAPPEVGRWRFDEGSGTAASDGSTFANDGILEGSPSWIPGVSGSALLLDGNADRVVIADDDSLDITQNITMAAWIRPTEIGSQAIVKKAADADGYELSTSNSGRLFVRFNRDSAGNLFKLLSTSEYPTDGITWMHVAATFDGQEIKLYVDGVLEVTRAAGGLVIGTNDEDLSIGADFDGNKALAGAVDDVRLFGTALSADEVANLIAGADVPGGDSLIKTPLVPAATSTTTGEKPQSKVWLHDGIWWAVFPDTTGSHIWRLDGDTWSKSLLLSTNSTAKADVEFLEQDGVVHVLLFDGDLTELVSAEYVGGPNPAFVPWSQRPSPVSIPLSSADTAVIALDSVGRLWLAYEALSRIEVRYADSDDGFSSWSGPIVLEGNVDSDDIAAVVAFDGQVGVMWSDQTTKRFGFRVHVDGDSPTAWDSDEVPASQSALSFGRGMADNHLNIAPASDGTLYVAVKTGYDSPSYPSVALLVRRPGGVWDDLYEVDNEGTRGIVLLDEASEKIVVIYADLSGGDLKYRISDMDYIHFGARKLLIAGSTLNDPSSTGQPLLDEFVVIATSGSSALQVRGAQVFVNSP